MSMETDTRLTLLEGRMLRLQERLERIEAKLATEAGPSTVAAAPALSRPTPPPRRRRFRRGRCRRQGGSSTSKSCWAAGCWRWRAG